MGMNLPKQAYPAAEEASPAAVGKLFEDSIRHLYDDGSLTKVKEDSNWGYFSWTNWKFKYFEKIFQWMYKVASILKNIFFSITLTTIQMNVITQDLTQAPTALWMSKKVPVVKVN